MAFLVSLSKFKLTFDDQYAVSFLCLVLAASARESHTHKLRSYEKVKEEKKLTAGIVFGSCSSYSFLVVLLGSSG